MAIAAIEYISMIGLGDVERCMNMLREYADYVKSLNPSGQRRRASWDARVLMEPRDAEEECPNPTIVLEKNQGQFPTLWVNFTFDPSGVSEEEILALEARFDLVMLGKAFCDDPFR